MKKLRNDNVVLNMVVVKGTEFEQSICDEVALSRILCPK